MENNSFISTIKQMVLLAIIVFVLGIVVYGIWSLIKIPLWIISPYRCEGKASVSKPMKLSFDNIMKTPYTFTMIWSGGWALLFVLCVAMSWNKPFLWSESYDAARWSLYSFIVISAMFFLWGFVLELTMLFNYRKWVYTMAEING